MARLNDVFLIGKMVNDELEPKIVGKNQTDGENANVVLNFLMKTFDEESQRYINLTVAVWGEEMVEQCMVHLKKDDLICIKGELRYKFIFNHKTQQTERIYTNVKASSVEFLSKKMGTQNLDCYENKVHLVGNLVDDVIKIKEEENHKVDADEMTSIEKNDSPALGITEGTNPDDSFVVAIDRLYPTKQAKGPNSELTDFVTLVFDDISIIKGDVTQGASVIIDGKLMTRKKRFDVIEPRIVVKVNKIIGVKNEKMVGA